MAVVSECDVVPGASSRPGSDKSAQVEDFLLGEYRRLVAAMWTVTGTREAAEDLVQEGLARAMDYQRRGRVVEDLPAFVRSSAIDLSKNRWRSLTRERHALGRSAPEPVAAMSDRIETTMDLHRALLELPRREREAVALVYQLDLSVRQAAQRMGVAEGTVKALLSRARHHLADSIDDELEVRR